MKIFYKNQNAVTVRMAHVIRQPLNGASSVDRELQQGGL